MINPEFDKGMKAFDDGLTLANNPHPIHTDDYMSWEDGWIFSKSDSELVNFHNDNISDKVYLDNVNSED